MKLTEMPNIGKTLAKKLSTAGIDSPEKLIEIGSLTALMRIRTETDSGCLNMLYALEGAIRGVRWHSLSKDVKEELKRELSKLDI